MRDYIIVNGSDTRIKTAQDDLIRLVKVRMTEGWQPIGGVVYLGIETVLGFPCYVFCQAMVMPPNGLQIQGADGE